MIEKQSERKENAKAIIGLCFFYMRFPLICASMISLVLCTIELLKNSIVECDGVINWECMLTPKFWITFGIFIVPFVFCFLPEIARQIAEYGGGSPSPNDPVSELTEHKAHQFRIASAQRLSRI
jgi:hypothetical protein